MLELTEQQWKALDAGEPVEITDGRIIYVLTKEQFAKVERLMGIEEIDPSLFEFRNEVLFDQ